MSSARRNTGLPGNGREAHRSVASDEDVENGGRRIDRLDSPPVSLLLSGFFMAVRISDMYN